MPLEPGTVATLLAAQGYAVPDDELAEITLGVNRLLERARAWKAVAPFDEEPWPAWPLEPQDG
jgi:hypothetical protein